MKVFVVLCLAVAVSAMPMPYVEQQYYEPEVFKYGEPEEFVSSVEQPSTHYAPGGYRLITAGQYDLPYDFKKFGIDHTGSHYLTGRSGFSGYPELHWHSIPSHYYNYYDHHH